MTSGPYVSDAEIEAAAAILPISLGLDAKEAHRLVSAILMAAAIAREPSFARADGAVFRVETAFSTGRALWRCTDVGSRTITAVRMDRVVTPRPLGQSETWGSGADSCRSAQAAQLAERPTLPAGGV